MKSRFTAVVKLNALLALLALAGCGRDAEKQQEPPRSSPANYMNDPVYREQLRKQNAERAELAKTRNMLEDKMRAMVDAMKKKMPKASDAAVKAELEKSAEWRSLYKRMVDINTAIEDQRKRTMKIVGERITPTKKK